jgi:tetratricopeptide (TPR) repeat protein
MRFTYAVGIILTFLFALVCPSTAQQEQESGVRRQRYTIAEYNAYEHALAQRDPEKQVQQLDDFASRYPASALLSLVYSQYAKAYGELGDFGKVIEFADKLIALGNTVPSIERYAAHYRWADAYNKMDTADRILVDKTRDVAFAGVRLLEVLEKPGGMTDQDFAAERKRAKIFFYATAGRAAVQAVDYPASIKCFKEIQSLDAYDPGPLVEPRPGAIPH